MANQRIAMGKGNMVELRNVRKDDDLSFDFKIKIMKVLVWTVINCGAEG